MKITQLVSQPQLIKLAIDEPKIVEKYGEVIEFYTWDKQPMDVFMQLTAATDKDTRTIITIVKDLILDEIGKPIIVDKNMLPTDVMMAAIGLITQKLGG